MDELESVLDVEREARAQADNKLQDTLRQIELQLGPLQGQDDQLQEQVQTMSAQLETAKAVHVRVEKEMAVLKDHITRAENRKAERIVHEMALECENEDLGG